jgi:hypothetical protein
MSQVLAAFRERFNKAPPRRATLLNWEKRAFALGSVKDRPLDWPWLSDISGTIAMATT